VEDLLEMGISFDHLYIGIGILFNSAPNACNKVKLCPRKERGAEGVDSQLKSGKTKKEKERGSCLKRGPGQS